MDHKSIELPGAKPGWRLEGHLRKVDGKWSRLRVDARGPVHTNNAGAKKQWREMFGGRDCEQQARRFMQEHYGQNPFLPSAEAHG